MRGVPEVARWKPPVAAETGAEVRGDEGLEVGETRGNEADTDVPVLLVQKDDASNIQNETGEEIAGEIEGATGGISPILSGTTAMGQELSSGCGPAEGATGVASATLSPTGKDSATPNGGTSPARGEDESACDPSKGPTGIASATPSGGISASTGKERTKLSKRERKRQRWEIGMRELERRCGIVPKEHGESPEEMIARVQHMFPEMAKLLRRHLPRSP